MGRRKLTDEQRGARRDTLLDGAVEAIRQHGPGVSMEELARAAGVTKPILYRHFGHRDGMTTALAARFARGLQDTLQVALAADDAPRQTLEKTIDAYLEFVERDPEVYRFLVRRLVVNEHSPTPETVGITVGNFLRQVSTAVAVVLGEQLRRAGLDSGGAEPLAIGIVGMVHAAGDWWLDRPTMPRSRLVAYLVGLLWGGFEGMGLEPPATTPPL